MNFQSPRIDNWLYDLCKDVHQSGLGVFGQGRADWPVGALSDEYRALIERAELMGYITTEEREDFGADRLVIRLTTLGCKLLGVPPEEECPSLAKRLMAIFHR